MILLYSLYATIVNFSLLILFLHATLTSVTDYVATADTTATGITKSYASSSSSSVPVKVFILAGQSNMVGMGSIDHLDLLIQNANNTNNNSVFRTTLWNDTTRNYNERSDVYVKFESNHGPLTVSRSAGYAGKNAFGPEVMFGWTVTDSIKKTLLYSIDNKNDHTATTSPIVVLIKVAYGGRDLAIDFRPPSAGIGNYTGIDPTKYGWEYRTMINDAITALQTIGEYIPNYDPTVGYDLAGFVWFQGWNDVLDWNKVNEYESNLKHFIHDVRNDLNVQDLPFVIGELGMHGINPQGREAGRVLALRSAQYNVCNNYVEFQSTTKFVPTAIYAVVNDTITYNGIHHYYGRADTYYYIGEALGHAMSNLIIRKSDIILREVKSEFLPQSS